MTDQIRRNGFISAAGHSRPAGGKWIPVYNPATGVVVSEAYEVSPSDLDLVVGQAEDAFQKWRAMAPDDRGAFLRAWAAAIADHRDEIADIDVSEVGHLRREVLGDVDSAVRVLNYYAGMSDKIEGRTYSQVPGRLSYGFNEPFGVVVGINAYNANPASVALKAGPALVAGNAMIIKAPALAPSSMYRMVELALDAGLPPGVVSIVTGSGSVIGKMLIEHSGVSMVSFTGGPGAGRSVVQSSAQNIIPVVLELGGKSPAVLLPDANLDLAIPSIMQSNFVKSGQSCIAASRVLIHESQYEQVSQRFADFASRIRVGLPTHEDSQMGSLVSQAQRAHVDDLVHRAVGAGAQLLSGGAPADAGDLRSGAFYQPTVLSDVADDNPAARIEAFGPMASLLSYSTLDEAIDRANATDFGLSSQVWGNDAGAIHHVIAGLEAGSVWVNAHRAMHPTVPTGGTKQSGYGREFGFAAVESFTQSKSVVWDLTTERVLPYS